MKIKLLSLTLFAGLLGLSSCNLENDPQENYQQIPFSVCNLVIPAQGDSFAMEGLYTLTYYTTEGNLTVTTNNMKVDGRDISFITSAMPFTVAAYSNSQNLYMEVVEFEGGIYNLNNITVNNLKGFTSQIANVPPAIQMNEPLYPTPNQVPLVMQYNLNYDYQVKTFMADATYVGKTTIRTASSGDSFSNDGVLYRVYLKSGLNKADVVFYNAKFAPMMPGINFVLKDLDIKYTKTGYTISNPAGSSVVPQMISSDGLTPYPMYQFTSFLLNNSSYDLTTANIDYWINRVNPNSETLDVMETYSGTFSGTYVQKGPSEEKQEN